MSPSYAAKTPSSAFLVGPHSILVRNEITFNDRSSPECYWVDDFTGFDSTDLLVTAQPNVQEDGELPDPGFHGGRTMTMTGTVRCGSYPKLLDMGRALLDSMISLVESDLTVRVATGNLWLTQPTMAIACRPADRPQIDMKITAADMSGPIKRPFTIALRASSDPMFKSVAVHHTSIVPTIVSTTGRIYDRTYDLVYATTLDPSGSPGFGANSTTVVNVGNYDDKPILRFNGFMTGVVLYNTANGHKITLKDAIDDGDFIEIDVAAGTIKDSLGNNRASAFDTRSDWMTIQGTRNVSTGAATTGNNEIQLSVANFGGAPSVDIWWRDTVA